MYDVLRADRCISSNSIEARVPFGDLEFCMAAYILLRFRDVSFSVGAFASVATTTLCIISFYTLLWKVLPLAAAGDPVA